MGHDTPRSEIYPHLTSRLPDEGGMDFLHRVFNTSNSTGEPVTINTGSLHIQYQYIPGQTSFAQGLTLIDGQSDSDTYERFMDVANRFELAIALERSAIPVKPLKKLWSSIKLPWKK